MFGKQLHTPAEPADKAKNLQSLLDAVWQAEDNVEAAWKQVREIHAKDPYSVVNSMLMPVHSAEATARERIMELGRFIVEQHRQEKKPG